MASAHPAQCGHIDATPTAGFFRPSDSVNLHPSAGARGSALRARVPASSED